MDSIADALTKANPCLLGNLQDILSNGVWTMSKSGSTAFNSGEWGNVDGMRVLVIGRITRRIGSKAQR